MTSPDDHTDPPAVLPYATPAGPSRSQRTLPAVLIILGAFFGLPVASVLAMAGVSSVASAFGIPDTVAPLVVLLSGVLTFGALLSGVQWLLDWVE